MTHAQDIAIRVDYEFVVNEMDGEDIAENHPHDTLAELLEHLSDYDNDVIELEVWRYVGSNAAGVQDISYLQIDGGELPAEFDCGASVPKYIAKQFTEAARATIRERLER